MKVLFAVNNESISETIIKKYQKIYDELLEYKNVYYYNAIVKEIQNNKDYDIIVISEDLETISTLDKSKSDAFVLDKLEKIVNVFDVEEISPIPILFISNEKRIIKDEIIPNMFNLGIYDALVGKDRTITKICELIRNPRTEEQAREYYGLGAARKTSVEKEIVNPKEINNILRHYKKILSSPDRFSSSFDRIVTQYDDVQLKYIIDKLPKEVKDVLEQQNTKYQEILDLEITREEMTLQEELKKETQVKSDVVIPTETSKLNIKTQIKSKTITAPTVTKEEKIEQEVSKKTDKIEKTEEKVEEIIKKVQGKETLDETIEFDEELELDAELPEIETPVEEDDINIFIDNSANDLSEEVSENVVINIDKKDVEVPNETEEQTEIVIEGIEDDLDIFGDFPDDDFIPIFGVSEIEDEEDANIIKLENLEETDEIEESAKEVDLDVELQKMDTREKEEILETEEKTKIVKSDVTALEKSTLNQDDTDIFDDNLLKNEDESIIDLTDNPLGTIKPVLNTEKEVIPKIDITEDQKVEMDLVVEDKKDFIIPDLSAVLSKDKKVVIFVGTSKNGTSFLVNSLGMMFASIGINTAILDMTRNRNSYYLSTKNDERLRQIAIDSTKKLREGVAMGVDVVRGLTVYTALPGDKDTFVDSEKILSTLLKNYSLVLIDADFNTNFGYFSAAQEIYLVQSLDVLTMQPLTAFLKELLDAGILTTEKVKVVLNKEVAVRGLTRKLMVGGLSTYNDPAMSIMTNLFDRNQVQVASIPFDQNVYSKYLENIVECKYDISGYPKKFVEALKILANMVYPLISRQRDVSLSGGVSVQNSVTGSNPFTNEMSSTLEQMRRRF